jgi:zinc transporter, ZIP family
MVTGPFLRPFLITLGSGMATSIGAAFVFWIRPNDDAKFSSFLALSAGVMMYLCFLEMLPEGRSKIVRGEIYGGFLFLGTLLVCMITQLTVSLIQKKKKSSNSAIVSAIAITIHNFPEGISTFYSNSSGKNHFGIAMAIALALHNIPEGVAVALPIYRSTNSKWKAFWLGTLSGFAQPFAAIFGYLCLGNELSDLTEGIIYCIISGIMVFISAVSLYPCSLEFNQKTAPHFFIAGMVLMGATSSLIQLYR